MTTNIDNGHLAGQNAKLLIILLSPVSTVSNNFRYEYIIHVVGKVKEMFALPGSLYVISCN